MATPAPETPIIIGVADVKNRSTRVEDAKEPLQLIHEAVLAALEDSSSRDVRKLRESIDSVDLVKTWTWEYEDLPGLLAERLGGLKLRHKRYSEHGGNQPGRLVDEAARRVARGDVRCAVVGGGEALASLSACAAAKKLPPPGWTNPSKAVDKVFTPTGRDLGDNLGAVHDIGAPIHVYPLYENAYRAHRGQSIKDNNQESAELYAEFSAVAEKNKYAWNEGKRDGVEAIGRVAGRNRLICFPYPLLMNAFNTVNLAGACIITSVSFAKSLGIPPEKWVYPLGGAGTKDTDDFWNRPNFYSSPSISLSIDAALGVSDTRKEDIDLYDIYSCFPIVPKMVAGHLDKPVTKGGKDGNGWTLLGGLTSFGGAGNNYSMHAFTEMTRRIREGDAKKGLVLCNGGVLSYQHVVILGKAPREDGGAYPDANPLGEKTGVAGPALAIGVEAEGEGVVETYTVEYNRDGSPLRGYIVGRLKDGGKRFLANHGSESTLRLMAGGTVEIVGRKGWLKQDSEREGRGLFTFDDGARI